MNYTTSFTITNLILYHQLLVYNQIYIEDLLFLLHLEDMIYSHMQDNFHPNHHHHSVLIKGNVLQIEYSLNLMVSPEATNPSIPNHVP